MFLIRNFYFGPSIWRAENEMKCKVLKIGVQITGTKNQKNVGSTVMYCTPYFGRNYDSKVLLVFQRSEERVNIYQPNFRRKCLTNGTGSLLVFLLVLPLVELEAAKSATKLLYTFADPDQVVPTCKISLR